MGVEIVQNDRKEVCLWEQNIDQILHSQGKVFTLSALGCS